MPLVQQQIQAHFGKPPRKGVHPDECVALGAALLADSLGTDGRGDADRRALDAHRRSRCPTAASAASSTRTRTIPMTKSFRLPAAHASPARRSSRWTSSRATASTSWTTSTWARSSVPAGGRGPAHRLQARRGVPAHGVRGDGRRGVQQVELATRDTPVQLKAALAKEEAERQSQQAQLGPEPERGGIFSSIRRIWGGN